jgi:hypothetical protein
MKVQTQQQKQLILSMLRSHVLLQLLQLLQQLLLLL